MLWGQRAALRLLGAHVKGASALPARLPHWLLTAPFLLGPLAPPLASWGEGAGTLPPEVVMSQVRSGYEPETGCSLPTAQEVQPPALLHSSGPKWNLQSLVHRALLPSGSGGPFLPHPPQRAPEL